MRDESREGDRMEEVKAGEMCVKLCDLHVALEPSELSETGRQRPQRSSKFV